MQIKDFMQTELGKFVYNLTLCDHMGDVVNKIDSLFYKLKLDINDWEDGYQLRNLLDEKDKNNEK